MLGTAIVIADLQADCGNDKLRSDPSVPLQQWRTTRFYEDLATLWSAHGCQYLIDLGDTTEVRSSAPWQVVGAVSRGLWTVNPDPLLSFKLVGNHEQLYRNTQISSGDFYRRHHLVVESRLIMDLGDQLPVVVAVSYPEDHLELESWLAHQAVALRGRRTLLLGHFQVRGIEMNSGVAVEGVDPRVLNPYSLGLLGHVHRAQQVRGTNVHYVGSPFQQDLGEAGEDKRVGLLDLETLDLRWLELPSRYPKYSQQSVHQFEQVTDLWEDRPVVTVRDAAEAQRFYALPGSQTVRVSLEQFKSERTTPQASATLERLPLIEAYTTEVVMEGVTQAELMAQAEVFCLG